MTKVAPATLGQSLWILSRDLGCRVWGYIRAITGFCDNISGNPSLFRTMFGLRVSDPFQASVKTPELVQPPVLLLLVLLHLQLTRIMLAMLSNLGVEVGYCPHSVTVG